MKKTLLLTAMTILASAAIGYAETTQTLTKSLQIAEATDISQARPKSAEKYRQFKFEVIERAHSGERTADAVLTLEYGKTSIFGTGPLAISAIFESGESGIPLLTLVAKNSEGKSEFTGKIYCPPAQEISIGSGILGLKVVCLNR
jgi:hypothetical protein